MHCTFQINEVCSLQSAISLGVAGEDEYLHMLSGFFQEGHYTAEAVGIGGGEHIIEDYELTLFFRQHSGKRKAGS